MGNDVTVELTESAFRSEESMTLPVMVAFPVPAFLGSQLLSIVTPALPDDAKVMPLDQLHLTLAVLGEAAEVEIAQDSLIRLAAEFAVTQNPIVGTVSGVGLFNLEDGDYKSCLYASFDATELTDFRHELVEYLELCGVTVAKNHGFQPHVTLAYLKEQSNLAKFEIPKINVTLDQMVVAWGDVWAIGKIGGWSKRINSPQSSQT